MKPTTQHRAPPDDPAATDIFAQNIQSVADLLARREARLSPHQRSIESVTNAIGRPRFLYINLVFIAAWMTLNSGLFGKPLDAPPYFWMTTVIAIESVLVTGMVLISQNRQRQEADRRAHLDLQINLLSEQKISKILSVLEELSERGLSRAGDPEIKAMQEAADPEILLTALEFAMDSASDTETLANGAPAAGSAVGAGSTALAEAQRQVAAARETGGSDDPAPAAP
jgi:uncharacterized membrane protein